tara:strand:+ start:71 stop:1141 length:1071 start_codon:yes stop_codon:yes gene_type:complete
MDNFDFKKYVTEGRIHQDVNVISEDKKQGYDDREDESLGARKGAEKGKKQSMKDRRDDSYGKFGKRDAEAKGKKKGPGKNKVNKESVEVDEGFEDVVDDIMDQGKSREDAEKIAGAINRDYVGNYRQEEGLEEKAPGFKHDCAAHVMHESYGYGLCLEGRHTLVETTDGNAEVTHYDVMFKNGEIVEKISVNELKVVTSEMHTHKKYEEDDKDPQNEDARTDAEQEGYKDGFDDAKDDIESALKKMKVSELKAKIRETILSELEGDEVNEEEEVDVDIDVEDEVEVEAGADDIEIERPGVKAKVQVGLSPEEEIVQDSLKAAMDAADALGNDKLADQIGNTITFFTREYVVGRNSD